jgi:hypothetical protein
MADLDPICCTRGIGERNDLKYLGALGAIGQRWWSRCNCGTRHDPLCGTSCSIGIDVSGLSPAEISALADAYQQSGLSEAAGAHDTKFGANTAPKSDLIIARDGSGYKYVSDFVKGTNPYKPT